MNKYRPGDLETAIMLVWQTSEDIDLLYKHHGDAPRPMTEDEIGNALLGIKILHDMRCEALMEMHCKVFELNQYCTDPVKLEAREAVNFNVNKPKKKGNKK